MKSNGTFCVQLSHKITSVHSFTYSYFIQFPLQLRIYYFQLFKHFGTEKAGLECYGRSREWNIDLIPKFLMADGKIYIL